MAARKDPLQRFMTHVEVAGDCLLWTSTKAGQPGYQYGTFRPGGTAPKVYAHRWIYERLVGPIPEGMEVDHVRELGCVGYLCVKISHLQVVTEAENHRRKRLKVCRAGLHDLSMDENVRWDERGRRRGCLLCHQSAALARYHAQANGRV